MIWRILCYCSIVSGFSSLILAQRIDKYEPQIEGPKAISRDTVLFIVSESLLEDSGLDSIMVSRVSDTSLIIKIIPELTPCSFENHTVEIVEKHGYYVWGLIEIQAKDCAGNVGHLGLIIDPYDYWEPRVLSRKDSTNSIKRVVVGDTNRYDSGLSRAELLNPDNFIVSISPPIQPCALKTYTITAERLDSVGDRCLYIRLMDCFGNRTDDSICFEGVSGSVDDETSVESCELIGNPAIEKTILRLTLQAPRSAVVRILDIAGKEMGVQHVAAASGITDIPIVTASLVSGTYYIVAEWGGRQFAKKLQVIK